jgi:hypothetical protein
MAASRLLDFHFDRRSPMTSRSALFSAFATLALASSGAAAHAGDYIALGDSYAYGFTTTQALVSAITGFGTTGNLADEASLLGLQGYVAPFAASQGISPANVLNLALPGETLTSFLTGGNTAAPVNLNYAATPTDSQNQLLAADLAGIQGSGQSVQDITIQLGGNDLLGLTPALNLTPPTPGNSPQLNALQQATVSAALLQFNTNYIAELDTLKTVSPNVFVVGYFDPFTPLGDAGKYATSDPFFGYGSILLPDLNAALASDAAAAGATFVNIDTPTTFLGNEIALSEDTTPLDQSLLQQIDPTYKPSLPDSFPDYHPNPTGYGVIAQALANAATVPEPAPAALLTLALPLLGLVARRRRSAQN